MRSNFRQLEVPPWLIFLEFSFSALLLYLLSNAPGLSFPATSGQIAQQRPAAVVAESSAGLHSRPPGLTTRFDSTLD